jgi:hypothetical protein
LHFGCPNKPYEKNPTAKKFVETYLKGAKALESDAGVLRFASDHIKLKNGFILEMGVATGRTINFIAALNPTKKVFGFDSFEGLPTDWVRLDITLKAGKFKFIGSDTCIPVLKNVVLYKGLFKTVLPVFKDQILKENPIAFLHIDGDLYQSAKDVFDTIGDNIVGGTIIVFDELYNYPGYEAHEWKAFQEFIQEKNLKIEFLAFNRLHEQVAVRVVNRG